MNRTVFLTLAGSETVSSDVRMMNEMGPKTTELVELMTELDELLARFESTLCQVIWT